MARPATRAIAHVTLHTGDIAMCPRSSLADDTRAALAPLVEAMRAGRPASIPGVGPGWIVRPIGRPVDAGGGRGCLHVRIERQLAEGEEPALVASVGVAARSLCGSRLWRQLHQDASQAGRHCTDPARQPVAPWLGTALLSGVALLPPGELPRLGWLADFSQCLAWCWLLDVVESSGQADA